MDSYPMTAAQLAARVAELEQECERLRRIIDSRPAINAGLPQTYIEWSQGIYLCDFLAARGTDDAPLGCPGPCSPPGCDVCAGGIDSALSAQGADGPKE